jgi:hypothetical protein
MSDWTGLLAQLETVQNTFGLAFRLLGAAVGFVLGGLLTGLVVRLVVIATSGKKLPRGLLYFFRLLGGVATALIVFLVMGHVGGGGWGWREDGPGGGKAGTGKDGSASVSEKKDKNPPRPSDENNDKGGSPQRLEIEVLGNDPVRQLEGEQAVEALRFYRVREVTGNKLLTLEEAEKLLVDSEGEPKWREIVVAVYRKDGPDLANPRVTQLTAWIDGLRRDKSGRKAKPEPTLRTGHAPLK